jgi:hypothetical protein
LNIRVGRSGTAAEVDVKMVDATVRDENEVVMTLLRCRTMSARDVSQLETQSEIFEGDALKMLVLPFLKTGKLADMALTTTNLEYMQRIRSMSLKSASTTHCCARSAVPAHTFH